MIYCHWVEIGPDKVSTIANPRHAHASLPDDLAHQDSLCVGAGPEDTQNQGVVVVIGLHAVQSDAAH